MVGDGAQSGTLFFSRSIPARPEARCILAVALEAGDLLPRQRCIGSVTLDLLYRDARLGSAWLRLHPREFGLLWRLSDRPGETVSRAQLLRDVWRIDHVPETNSVEVHISRLRAKLVESTVCLETRPGGYRLGAPADESLARGTCCG